MLPHENKSVQVNLYLKKKHLPSLRMTKIFISDPAYFSNSVSDNLAGIGEDD